MNRKPITKFQTSHHYLSGSINMKTQLRLRAITVAAILLLIAVSSLPNLLFASTTTTLLATETFSGGTFPPTGWTDNSYGTWYQSSNGNGGANGSAVFDFWDCSYNSGELLSPSVDASAFSASGDTAFVDFDLWFEKDGWDVSYGGDVLGIYVHGQGGVTLLKSLSSPNDATYDNSSEYSTWYYDPLTSSQYWVHYHLGIPTSQRGAGMQIGFSGDQFNACGGNAAIDNVTITGTHYNRISYSPAFIDFGTRIVGSTSGTRSVVVSNPNPTPITISGASISGPQASDYTLTRSPTVIPAGTLVNPGLDSFLITVTPTAVGNRSASLSFSNSSDGPTFISVPLSTLAVAPTISVAPKTLFTKTRTKLGSFIDQYVLVTASGAGSLIISPTSSLSGDYPSEYSILKLPTLPIANGQSDTIWVRYHPTIEGSRPAILNIVSNASNGVQQVILKGTGVLGRLVITPNNLNFDSVSIGLKTCRDITIYNAGSDTVVLTRNYLSSADGDFTLTPVTGSDSILPPDKSRTATVCFTPIRNGIRQARFRITTNIPLTFDSPKRDTSSFFVDIVGEGLPSGLLSIGGSAIVDSMIVGQQLCKTDTFYNRGTADVTITSAKITGADSSDYKFSGVTFPLVVAPGASQVFTICVTPSQRGDRNASLNIAGTTGGQAVKAILPLDVFGQLTCASASPASAFTSKTCVGSTDTAFVKVSNCGDVAMSYTAAVSANGTSYAIVGSTTSSIIGANGFATFPVVFKPTDRLAQDATLTITGSKGNVTQIVNLNGTGQAATIAGNDMADSTRVNSTSTFSLMLHNTGECDWTPGTPSLSDPNFGYVSGGTTNIPAGGMGMLMLSFTPTTAGMHNSTVTFANASGISIPAASANVSGFAISGAGVARITEANGYSLQQNYPNPFNPTTEIRFTVANGGNVKLNIVDVTGKIVRTVFDERMSAGEHSTVVNASELSSGVYYYQLSAGNTVLTRQMVLAK
jgi:hypothetical protein